MVTKYRNAFYTTNLPLNLVEKLKKTSLSQYFSSASPRSPEMTEDCKLEVQKDR